MDIFNLDSVKDLLKNVTSNSELEVIFNKSTPLTVNRFIDMLKYITILSKNNNFKLTKESTLDVGYTKFENKDITNYRITISNIDNINTIINNVRSLVSKAATDYKTIITKYDEIKTFWEKMELHKNNLDTMNFKKKLIDDTIKNFNINIENINNINMEINSLIVNDDLKVENLLKLVDNINSSLKNQIINNKQTINNLFNEISTGEFQQDLQEYLTDIKNSPNKIQQRIYHTFRNYF